MTLPSAGRDRRLQRLLNAKGFYFFLAMDHSLTLGPLPGNENLQHWLDYCVVNDISGIVINRGALSITRIPSSVGLIYQTFGMPDPNRSGRVKVTTARIRDALRASADLISVQINPFTETGLSELASIQEIVSGAEDVSLPVMFMINVPDLSKYDIDAMLFGYRVASELGADIVKIPIPHIVYEDNAIERVKQIISNGPAVVLAGGGLQDDFIQSTTISMKMGFAGVCVGRNIFQNPTPNQIVEGISNIYARTTLVLQ